MITADDCRKQLAVYFQALGTRTRTRDHSSRANACRVLQDLYGLKGPDGVKNEDLLAFVNERLVAERRSQISIKTLLRARKDQYGW